MHNAIFIGSGLVLIAIMGAVSQLALDFDYGGNVLDRPTPRFVALMMIAGAVYLCAAAVSAHITFRWRLFWLLAVGLAMRALLFTTAPILETDFYRYLWDGGVLAHGHNPYAHTPAAVAAAEGVPESLARLGPDSGYILRRVNHPEYATVYPPMAQAAFALAHLIAPWSLLAWRGVLLLFEIATLALIYTGLRVLNRQTSLACIYWWNPLVVKEFANSAHMDAVALPFAVAALLLALRAKPIGSAAMLALGTGAKVWPVVLIPALYRAMPSETARRWTAAAIGFALIAVAFVPILAAPVRSDESGFLQYGRRWEMNDALFVPIQAAANSATALLGGETTGDTAKLLARAIAAVLLVAWLAWICRRAPQSPDEVSNRAGLALGGLFLLSPAQFPWYYTWLVPFLALRPRASLLVLTPMLPLYYLRFYYDARGQAAFFDHILVWIEYAPVFAIAAFEAWRARRSLP